MKRIYLLLALLAWMHVIPASAVQTDITILGVTFSGSNATNAGTYMGRVATYWPTATGTTITLANGGAPVSVGTALSGTDLQQMNQARLIAYGMNLRNTYQADVIFFFTSTMVDEYNNGICGWAPQRNWTAIGGGAQTFDDPDMDGIDRAGAEDWYAAIMATTGTCASDSTLSLHEFGHLFGAGHEYTGGAHLYLYNDSHAYFYDYPYPYPDPRSNMHTNWWNGYNWFQYSDAIGTEYNYGTLAKTALSVANYRPLNEVPPSPPSYPPPPPSGCSLTAPAYLTERLIGHCAPYPYSHFIVTWGDSCPSQTTHYQVWTEQPVGSGYLPDWTVYAPFTDAYVTGASGRIRVQACNGGTCSALSPDSVLLVPQC